MKQAIENLAVFVESISPSYKEAGMSVVENTLERNVSVSTAYKQWAKFGELPHFMEGVDQVQQIDDKHLHWRAGIAGEPEAWDSEITEQVPDQSSHRVNKPRSDEKRQVEADCAFRRIDRVGVKNESPN